jgi:Holliday junction resolvase RusA-like endonuclease
MDIRIFIPGIPGTAGSKKGFVNPKTGRVIVTDSSGKKGKTWRSDVQVYASQVMGGRPPLSVALDVTFTFILPRPKGHFGSGKNSGTVKASAPRYPETRPDALKMARAAEDALTGICYRDDSLIVDEHLYKRYSDEGKAGCWITIRIKEANEDYEAPRRELAAGQEIERQGLWACGLGG